jgi:hypothetical protein
VFNQGFFNKWSVHQALNQHPSTTPHIPETHISPSTSQIEEMLKRHQMVYLKPSGGSLGLGIYRITHDPKQGYFCRFRQGEKNVLHRYKSIDGLLKKHFTRQSSFQKYLVQQGIRLIRHKGRPVDFRVHLHKGRSGQWKVVAIGSKVAGSGSVTTHVRTGGSILSTHELLQQAFQQDASRIHLRLQQAAVTIARVLEQQIPGPLGELGMDIGIDQTRRIWLFEINSKPGRHIFHHPTLRDAGKKSAKFITDYSLKLADFV